jgi:multiple sugar transport system permease protein
MGARRGTEHVPVSAALLLVFGLFSWFPIGRAVVMSLQSTNLVTDPYGWGWTTSVWS